MHRMLLSLGLLAGTAASLAAQAGRIQYEQFTLSNGLQVIYSADHSTPIVTVDLWYDVGSRNERPGRSGFAHLFEHMMYQGSAHVQKAEHSRLIERAGGGANASPSEDQTKYYATVPSNRLNLALWLEADRMRSLAVTQENLNNQREAVKEERRLKVDNQPYQVAFTEGLTWPFDSTGCFGYAHTIIGAMPDLDAAQLTDVKSFFDAYYAPNNATLVVVGDFQPADLRRLVDQYFGGIAPQPAPAPVACDFRFSPGAVRREVSDPRANLAATLRFYRLPSHRHADTPALELLNLILGQGESSRLNVGVVRREKAALEAGVFANPYGSRRGPGVMIAFGFVNQGVEAARLDSLLAVQIDSVRTFGVTAQELEKAKNIMRAGFVRNRETTYSKAEELQHYRMFHGSIDEINTDLDKFVAVTSDDIQRVASKYLDPANAVIVIVRPGASQGGSR